MSEKKPQRIEIFIDFLCPYCGKFYAIWGEKLRKLQDLGLVELEYTPLAWIDKFSGGERYSTRAAAAAELVRCEDSARFLGFVGEMYKRENQPKEAARYSVEAGSNAAIAGHARDAEVSGNVVERIGKGDFAGFEELVERTTKTVTAEHEIEYTPTVKINGAEWVYQDALDVARALRGLPGLTEFQLKVLQVIAEIPEGKTRTYGEIAGIAGVLGAARAVGSVCKTNPLPFIIPCHRVVPAAFAANPTAANAGEYALGKGLKVELLREEGVIP
jgi:O-6-methylguanine DNA methyltransferase